MKRNRETKTRSSSKYLACELSRLFLEGREWLFTGYKILSTDEIRRSAI